MLPSWADPTERAGALRAGYYAVVAAYLVSWLVLARAYRPDARLLPIAVAAALLGLICLRVVSVWADVPSPGIGAPSTDAADTDADADPRRAAIAFGWLAVLAVAVVLVGLVSGIGIVATGFLLRYDRPRRAALLGPATALSVYLLFVRLLDLPTYDPVVVRLLGGVIGG